MTKKTRIRWSDAERASVTQKMAQMLNDGCFLQMNPLLKAAQAVLPEDRRRSVFTNAESKGMFFKAEELAALRLKDPVAQPPKPEPIVEHKPDELYELLEMLIDRMANRVANKVAERLAAQLQVQVHTTTTTHSEHRPRHNPQPVTGATGAPKLGVLVLGIQPHQAGLLKADFPQLDITCYDSDEARTKPVLQRAHVIAMTRFLSHAVDDRYKKSPRYHRLNHGFSELKTFMNMILRGEV